MGKETYSDSDEGDDVLTTGESIWDEGDDGDDGGGGGGEDGMLERRSAMFNFLYNPRNSPILPLTL